MEWLFLSNMFPSASDPSYGAFVARSLSDLKSQGIKIAHTVVIEGRHSGWAKLRRYLDYFRRIFSAGSSRRVEAIYAHYASHHCLPIALLALLFRKKLVLHIHGDDLAMRQSLSRALNRTGQHTLVKHARLIIVPSLYFSEMLRAVYRDVDENKIFVSPSSGVEIDAFAASGQSRVRYWDTAGSAPTIAHFGYVGRIDADKGWKLIFEACAKLPHHLAEHVHLHFWGSGQELDDLHLEISKIGFSQATYHGHVEPDKVPDIHREFDFQIIPSYRESLGLSAIEGLAAGHVVLCSAIRPFTDFTTDGETAIHFAPGDAESLCSAMTQVITGSSVQWRAMSVAASRLARQYDRQLVAKQLSDMIRNKVCSN
ncbi:glycosyltransferase family 4 protein [Azohydromonas aeria]|uniref:glycosyltransferase family 4 protein n=1 Tax=Azohydromonas aeria TaxID=2590212 RepID=UPI0018DFAE43|nr:glycosyltransferase family 4 protein [Azohydromonas aeria]